MANGLYTSFKNALLNKELDLDTDTLIVALLDNTYTVDLANDSDYTTACSAAEISAGTLLGTTITDEVFNAMTSNLQMLFIQIQGLQWSFIINQLIS